MEVFTDHKNLVHKTFNTERVMRWRLIIEECGPKLTHIKGENNIVADALSRMRLTEKDFSEEAFAGDANASDSRGVQKATVHSTQRPPPLHSPKR